ncbi:F-box/kelch-repeat protein SKIP11-like [Diospyros lotus]|uniref:F-box/kelch-repeat protein SKIP11-like n=1 Tax=Diospyros lotus TaxID=55363 RepID=UPI00224DA87D|nr:F-box/kelch-repeat protein SKIP11-like [Diospyros lotus]
MQTANEFALSPADASNSKQVHGDCSNSSSSLNPALDQDVSNNCLLHCSRADYGSIASLNKSFRSLLRSGELYRLRRERGIIEHWVYFSCGPVEWQAFDPVRRRFMHLPKIPEIDSNVCFVCSDKESLAVGTELLLFGKDIMSFVIYKYSLLTNLWSIGTNMNQGRCLIGSASLGETAIVAGGCDLKGNILQSAELYDSNTGSWTTLPDINTPRKMCSGFFMDGKFYVIGGIGRGNRTLISGEMYDMETRTWTEIPSMFPSHNPEAEPPGTNKAPPLVAVVKNELYAADPEELVVSKYDKEKNVWATIGPLPESSHSMHGWGIAFRACGDQLLVIGGTRYGQVVEINGWVPDAGPLRWNLLGRKYLGNFVYNCTVMGC